MCIVFLNLKDKGNVNTDVSSAALCFLNNRVLYISRVGKLCEAQTSYFMDSS